MDPEKDIDPQAGQEEAADQNGQRNDDLDSALRAEFDKAGVDVDETIAPVEKKDDQDGSGKEADGGEKPEGEKKVEPIKKIDPKVAKAKPAESKTDAPDPDKIAPPAKLSKEGMAGWNALKETAKKNHSLVQERDKQIQELQSVIASQKEQLKKETEELGKELKELRGFRAQSDYQFDPQFQKEFGEPMGKLTGDMTKMLKNMGVTDDVIKSLRFDDEKQMARVADTIEENENKITADRFRSRVRDYIELAEKKKEFLDGFKQNHEKFMTQRQQEAQRKSIEAISEQHKHLNERAMKQDESGNFHFPFLIKYEPAEGATKEQIAAIEAHNKMADTYRQSLDMAVRASEPKDRAEIALAAVSARFLQTKLQEVEKQLADARQRLEKYNKVSSEKGSTGDQPKAVKVNAEQTADEALETAFPNMR